MKTPDDNDGIRERTIIVGQAHTRRIANELIESGELYVTEYEVNATDGCIYIETNLSTDEIQDIVWNLPGCAAISVEVR